MADNKIIETRLEELMPIMEECLSAGKSFRFSPRGVSMLPLLREGKDSVLLSPLPEKLRKYDVPLYRRDDGKYVLRRIVAAGETYTCIGDNQFVYEPGLRQDQMIAVMTGFYRGEKFHSVDEAGYKLYCRIWDLSRRLRHFWLRGIGFLRRHLK